MALAATGTIGLTAITGCGAKADTISTTNSTVAPATTTTTVEETTTTVEVSKDIATEDYMNHAKAVSKAVYNSNKEYFDEKQYTVEDLENVLLRAKFTLKIKFTEHHVAYIYTTKEECLAEKADVFTISRSIVNTMSGIRGIDVWVNFTEDINSDIVYCEIRSSKYNINPIATKFGGGGHAKASGATLCNKEKALELLNELDALLEVENGDRKSTRLNSSH